MFDRETPAWGGPPLEPARNERQGPGSLLHPRDLAASVQGNLWRMLLLTQHFRDEHNNSRREVLGLCAQEMDKALSVLVQRVKTTLLKTVDKLDTQLQTLENNMR